MCQVYERCKCGSLVWLKNHATTSDGDTMEHRWWNTCYKCKGEVEVISGGVQNGCVKENITGQAKDNL